MSELDTKKDDVKLMLEFQGGNELAFNELYERYKKKMLNFAFKYTQDIGMAEELCHETFLNVYKAKDSYSPKAKFSTWLYRICTNVCLNELRKGAQKMRTQSIDENRDKGIADTSPAKNQHGQLIEKELKTEINKVLKNMPERQRMAFVLRRFSELSYEEIAKALGTSEKAVKSLLNRAKDNVLNELKKRGVI